jgi:DNA/RNA endonuclease G (NUC1)
MSNMTPQTGASNRGPYRILEMASREWAAASNGGIWTIAGAIFSARPKTIGRTKVAVPAANWKIVVRDNRAVAVIIPNSQSYRGPHGWQDFIVPVAEIERQAGIRINLPAGVSHDAVEPAWPVNHAPWTVAHQTACATLR